MTGNEKKGYFFVFLTGVFFAIEVIGFKEVFRRYKLEPEIAAFYGVSAAALFVSFYFLFHKTRRENIKTTIVRDGKVLLLGTFSNAIGIVMYYAALRISDLGPSAILIKTTVLYNVLLGVFLLGEKLKAFESFGIILALVGIYEISTLGGQITVISSLIILTSAFLFAIQSYLIKRYVPDIFGMEYAFLRLILLSLFFGLYIWIKGSFLFPPLTTVIVLGLFSVLGYFFGRAFFFEAHKYLPISKLNASLLIEPIFLMFVGYLFMNESLELQKLLGAAFILSGLYLLILHKRKNKNESEG
ncbi:DMT family transporter [Leptospira idonii]|uniref:DMT family transporter n=1 Tax=Leptospira idonii TaxID=1193500 RepID=A0A4R9M1U4_9LEPT|nr:DMT family transporter [Leptospira idonii]TGN20703.1 DMT family transporter [Leptospira idonii]